MDSYGTKLATWCEEFLNRLNLAAEVCDAAGVPTHTSGRIVRDVACSGLLRFTGAWSDEHAAGAVEQGDLMLVITVLGGTQDAGYRVKIQCRHIVDTMLSRYQDQGARTAGRGVVQASEQFKSPDDAADWVLEHNAVLLDLMRTCPAEVEEFKTLKDLAASFEHTLDHSVEVIRNTNDFQVRINFENAALTKRFLKFLLAHE
jgi:hypothetical protein